MEDDLKQTLDEIIKLNKENQAMLKKIGRHFFWQKIFSLIYFILIVGPIVIGFIYLPPLLKNAYSEYQELLNLPSGAALDVDALMKTIKIPER